MLFEVAMKKERQYFVKGPHPKTTIPNSSTAIQQFIDQGWIWQLKINGRRLQIVLLADGRYQAWTRHGKPFSTKIPAQVIASLFQFFGPQKSYTIIEGEWLDGKYYLFDMLVKEGKSLSNLTYKERHSLLKRDYILPYMALLPLKTSVKEAMKVLLCEDDRTVEGIVLKSPHPGMTHHHIVRCRKMII